MSSGLLILAFLSGFLLPSNSMSPDELDEPLNKLLSRDPIVVEEGVVALAKLDAKRVQTRLRRMILEEGKSPQLPSIVCDLIGQLGSEADLDLFQSWLNSDDPALVSASIRALAMMSSRYPESSKIETMLKRCSERKDDPVALAALSRCNSAQQILRKVLRQLRDRKVDDLVGAVDFLRSYGAAPYQKEIQRAWKKIPKKIGHRARIAIVQALATIPTDQWIPTTQEVMREALENRDWRVRRRTVEVLVEIWKPLSVDLLLETLPENPGNPDLFDWHHALSDLTGEQKPVDALAWLTYAEMFPSPRQVVTRKERPVGGWLRAPAEGVGNAAEKGGPTVVFFDLPVLAADAVFLFDLSGSMNGDFGGRTRMEAARIEVHTMLEKWLSLPRAEQPRFNLVLFREPYGDPWNANIDRVFPRLAPLSPQNAQTAAQWFSSQGTCRFAYQESIEAAIEDPECRFVYFLSDGEPWGGRCNDLDRLLKELERVTRFHPVAIHNVVIGGAEKAEQYCEQISARHSGRLRKIGNASETMSKESRAPQLFTARKLGVNIIVNPGAEQDQIEAASGKLAKASVVSAWESIGTDTPVQVQPWNGYAMDEGDHLPVPEGSGKNHFLHGTIGDVAMRTTLRQHIDLKRLRSAIRKGATYRLSAWIGGWKKQKDEAQVRIVFFDEDENELGEDTLGPVTAADRDSKNGMRKRQGEGSVPAGSRKVVVEMIFDKEKGGSVSDAAIDLLDLVISKESAALQN
ncbi:MAG: hypothetical protein AAEJ04_08225 [Planctomycetota bacterium]